MTGDSLTTHHKPTPARPLLGMTVLAVEDSRFTCETLRLMCLRSGARLRRADCLRSARRHLKVYRPTIVIVDMGLPDGSGADLIADLADARPRVQVLLAISGDSFAEDQAIAAGADGFLEKPFESLAVFQSAIVRQLPYAMCPVGPAVVSQEVISPDGLAYQDDIAHAADLLEGPQDEPTVDYVAQFLTGVSQAAKDDGVFAAASALLKVRKTGAAYDGPLQHLSALLKSRLADRMAI